MGKDSSLPAAPNYSGAADQTAQSNYQYANKAFQSSLVNQNTPYGSLNYVQNGTWDDGTPRYSANIDLSSVGQQLLNNQNNQALGIGNAANAALGRLPTQGMDLSSVQDVADRAYQNYTSRLDPQWQRQQEQLNTQLVNQGLRPGTEAYDNAMKDFNYAKNDAYTQANTAAINTMPQTYQLASAEYNQPLNYLNALRSGSQVTNPSFVNTPQQQTTTGSNQLGATQAEGQYNQSAYNANQSANSSFTSGLLGLAGTALGAFF
jgi:hypothetical protein